MAMETYKIVSKDTKRIITETFIHSGNNVWFKKTETLFKGESLGEPTTIETQYEYKLTTGEQALIDNLRNDGETISNGKGYPPFTPTNDYTLYSKFLTDWIRNSNDKKLEV